ncbi:MAG: Tfp pilus assembly protein FimT/FimU [Thermosynechococcaceae cyanobacterium]
MLSFFTKRHQQRGFTLTEVTLVSVLIGVFAAIAAPSFLGWFNRYKVNDVLVQVEGALKEAKAESIKKGRICNVNIGLTITATVSGTTESCLPTGSRDLSKLGIRIFDNNETQMTMVPTSTTVQFSPVGTTTASHLLVFFQPGKTGRCLIVSNGIGIIRTGKYTQVVAPGAGAGTLTESACTPD